MTNARGEMVTTRPLWRWTALAAAIAAFSNWLICAAPGLPINYPTMLPAPPSCAADARFVPAVPGSSVLLALFAALLVAGAVIRPSHRDRTLRKLLIVVVIAAVVTPLWTLGASGFALG